LTTPTPRPDPAWLDQLPTDRLLAEVSLWSADLGRLTDEVERVGPESDILHIDVADGHFSPAMLFFPDLVARIRRVTAMPMHVHLMVADAILEAQIEQFAEAGADAISVHAENANVADAIALIRRLGVKPGLVLQLATPVAAAAEHLGLIGFLTLLGTEIGIKGQGLDPAGEPRLREAAALIAQEGHAHRILLAADGGIREHTVPGLRRAGAQTIVMGSLLFGAPDLAARMHWVRGLPVEPG
jgi:ribulose-phosphate 3-epimerase